MNSSSLTRRLFLALFVVGMVALTVVRPTFSLDAKPVATKPVATKPLDANSLVEESLIEKSLIEKSLIEDSLNEGQSVDQKPALHPLARKTMADLPYAEFPDQSDKSLQALLDDSIKAHQLTDFIDKNKLSITLVDITDINAPKLAHVNGSVSFYAASLPKLAILLAVFEEVHQNNLELTPRIDAALVNMIRNSSNIDATYLYELVGAKRIAEILESERYRFYDRNSEGGLWVGKPYGKQPAWQRDPLTNFSHAATGVQVARFYYMLQRNELTDPTYCPIIKEILSDSAIEHKFVKGLKTENPTAEIFRKSGTWRNYHSDSAIVESANGHQYIAVALSHTDQGSDILVQVIKYLDRIVEEFHSADS